MPIRGPGFGAVAGFFTTTTENLGLRSFADIKQADFADWLAETHSCQFWILLKSGMVIRYGR
jgi:hypothetical protein